MRSCLTESEVESLLDGYPTSDINNSEILRHVDTCRKCKEKVDTEKLFRELKQVVGHDSRRSTECSIGSTNSQVETQSVDDDLPEIPGYQIESRIRGGGQGVVFQALQESTNRQVAIKILRDGRLAESDRQLLFEKEIETVASFQHPNIVTLYEGGTHNGLHYYSMELLDGLSLNQHCDENPLAKFQNGRTSTRYIRSTLRIFLKILNAIAYAHRKGVIHRDLKPQNIFVDASCEPKILDFGLARIADLLQSDSSDKNKQSRSFFGTPAYASPEQLNGEIESIDTRSDVFSLGIVLFEALTFRLPFAATGSLAEIAKEIESQRPRNPLKLNGAIDSDVGAILFKMLEHEADDRYQSAEQVSKDIESFLEGRPIESKKDHQFYVFRKLVSRNWLASFSVFTTIVALVAALIVSTRYYLQAADDRDIAVESNQKANVALGEANVQRAEAELQNYIANLAAAAGALQLNDVVDCTKRLLTIPEKMRGWEWHHFLHYLDDSFQTVATHERYALFVGFGRSKNEIVSCSRDKKIIISYADQSQPTREYVRESLGPLAISPDHEVVAMAGNKGQVQFLRLKDLKVVSSLKTGGQQVTTIRYFPDGKTMAVGVVSFRPNSPSDVAVEVWDLAENKLLKKIPFVKWHVNSVSIASDRKSIGVVTYEGGSLWTLDSANRIARFPDRPGNEGVIVHSPDGALVATGGEDGIVYLYNASNGKFSGRLSGHRGKITAIRFFKDGNHLITSSRDKTIRIWKVGQNRTVRILKGHHWGISDIVLSADEKLIASSSWDKSIRLWDASVPLPDEQTRAHDGQVATIDYSTNGALFASASRDSTVRIWRTHNQKLVRTLRLPQPAHGVEFSHDDKLLAVTGWNQPVRIYDTKKWKLLATLDGHLAEARVHGVAFSNDDRWLFSGGSDNRLIVWDTETHKQVASLAGHDDHIHTVAVSPDNKYLASAGHRSIRIWSLPDFKLLHVLKRSMLQDDYSLAFHPTNNWLAAGADVGEINLWNVENGEVVATLKGHNDEIKSLDFYPDGSRLVTCSFDNRIIVWDTEKRIELLSLFGHSAPPNIIKFDPTGFYLVGGLENGDIKMWKGISLDDWRKASAAVQDK